MNKILIITVLVAALALGAESSSESTKSRQVRSVSSRNSNSIDQIPSAKGRMEEEKRQVQEFLTTRNIFKSFMKLFFGNPDEVNATSRNVLGILSKVLDLLKTNFGQKSRSAAGRGIRDSAEDAANAGISMLQGYVKSVLAPDSPCAYRHLCQASKDAIKDGRDLGYVVSSVGGYALGYLLDGSKGSLKNITDACAKGRSLKVDCATLYPDCNES